MKNRLLASAGCLAVLLVVGKIYEKPLLAQVRAALVQSIDEPGRNPFVLSSTNGQFTVPVGKRYVVEQYSAGCNVPNTYAMTDLTLFTEFDNLQHQSHVSAHFVAPAGFQGTTAINFYAATGMGPAYADGGSTITLLSYASNGSGSIESTTCAFVSVSGHVINNP